MTSTGPLHSHVFAVLSFKTCIAYLRDWFLSWYSIFRIERHIYEAGLRIHAHLQANGQPTPFSL